MSKWQEISFSASYPYYWLGDSEERDFKEEERHELEASKRNIYVFWSQIWDFYRASLNLFVLSTDEDEWIEIPDDSLLLKKAFSTSTWADFMKDETVLIGGRSFPKDTPFKWGEGRYHMEYHLIFGKSLSLNPCQTAEGGKDTSPYWFCLCNHIPYL